MKKEAAFARVLGKKIPNGPVFGEAFLSVGLVGEVFGPPEVRDGAVFWNFADSNGKTSYAIVAAEYKKPNEDLGMKFVAPASKGREFFDWATEKVNLTENGVIAPAFFCTQNTSLRVERL